MSDAFFKIVSREPSQAQVASHQKVVFEQRQSSEPFLRMVDENTVCPLYVAIINHDDMKVAQLSSKVDPSAKYSTRFHPSFDTGRNWTYLSYAIFENHLPTIALLLKNDGVVRAIWKDDYQPLRWSLESLAHTDALDMLLMVLDKDNNVPDGRALNRISQALTLSSCAGRNQSSLCKATDRGTLPFWLRVLMMTTRVESHVT